MTRFLRGFTMVELMVVISIVAILTALALPSFRDYFEKARVRGAADSLAGLIAQARSEAVRRDRQVVIAFAGAGEAWCAGANAAADPGTAGDAIPAPVACDCMTPANCNVGAVLGSTTPRTAINRVDARLVINPTLGATTALAPENIVFSSHGGRFSLNVQVTPLGHVRSCVPNTSEFISGYEECP